LKQKFIRSNIFFGASVGIGCWLSEMAAPAVVALVPAVVIHDSTLMNTKTLAVRLSEIGLGAGTSWALNKYLARNDYTIGSAELTQNWELLPSLTLLLNISQI
jgi:hypothetical protein